MVIRKKKAKKRKIRKNPHIDDNLIQLISNGLVLDSPDYLADILTYYSQGENCEDCDKIYEKCECEKCPDCKFNRCLCDINNYDEARNKIWKIEKKVLNDKQLLNVYENLILNYEYYLKYHSKIYWIEQLLKITKSQNNDTLIKKLRNFK